MNQAQERPREKPVYEVRNLWYPKLNHAEELRGLLKDVAEQRQARGQKTSVTKQMFTPAGQVFVVAFWDDSLEAFEARQRDISGREEEMAYLARARSLCTNHVMELYEVVVPFPASGM